MSIDLYFYILIALLALYFLFEDLIKLFRGKRDKIEEEQLPLADQVIRQVARDYGEKVPRSLSDPLQPMRQFRYSAIVQYWIIAILLFGLGSVWTMAIAYPTQTTGLMAITVVISLLCFYSLIMAWGPVKILQFDEQHLWMGKKPQRLFKEQDFDKVYYTEFLVGNFFSVQKHYGLIVFRKGFCFPPLHWFVDRFFPASNSRRQVFFLSTWKDEENIFVPAGAIVKRILEHCDAHGVKSKQWTSEAQFFLICFLLAGGFGLWIFFR